MMRLQTQILFQPFPARRPRRWRSARRRTAEGVMRCRRHPEPDCRLSGKSRTAVEWFGLIMRISERTGKT